MTYRRAVLSVLLVTVGIVAFGAEPALADCHAFSVSVQPGSVSEGGKVTITIARDGADAPSSVLLRTQPGSASSADFTSINARVSFTGDQVSQTRTLSTTRDTLAEGAETLSLQLSDGQGCDGSGFSYGSAVVTIQDVGPTTTTTQPPTTTTSSTTTSSSTTSSTSSTTSSTTTTTVPSTSSSSLTDDEEGDSPDTTEVAAPRTGLREEGGGSWMLPIALGGVAVFAFGGALFARHRLVDAEGVDDVDYDPDEEG